MKEHFSFVIVGHVDHGKSTLIGRLLYDTKSLPPDKLAEVEKITKEKGIEFQFAYLMDHLKEERDKNITIDTAQTFFNTDNREYVIIDAPGHREFIKNMITGASSANAAVVIIDAYEGIKDQTLRHTYLLKLLGIEQIIVLINKMDLVDYNKNKFDSIYEEYSRAIKKFDIEPIYYIPISAYKGDNVYNKSEKMPWYKGPTFTEALDSFKKIDTNNDLPPFYLVQDILNISNTDIVVGRLETGELSQQDVIILPQRIQSKIEKIIEFQKEFKKIKAGSTAGLILKETTIKRGNVITIENNLYSITNKFIATIFWFSDDKLSLNTKYELNLGTQTVSAQIEKINKVYDSEELNIIRENSDYLNNLEIGEIVIATDSPIVLTEYKKVHELGRFVLDEEQMPKGGGIVELCHI